MAKKQEVRVFGRKAERMKINDHYVYVLKAPEKAISFEEGQKRLMKILQSV